MSGARIMDAIGELPEDLLAPVAELRKKKRVHWSRWTVVAAACLCLLLVPLGWIQSRDMKAESMHTNGESPKEELEYGGDHSSLTADSVVCSFRGDVLEVYETHILVRPLDGEDELLSGDKIEVSLYQVQNVPEIAVGDTVEIFYSGQLQEVYPPRAAEVIQIRVVK